MTSYDPCPSRYETMQYRRCGRSGLKLPAISLGLWHNFGADTMKTARAMVHQAFDCGITHFDLANNYGPPVGSAEETFGKILALDLKAHRDEILVATKAGHAMWPGPYGDWGSRKYLLASIDQSLRRMDVEYVDIFYHHRPDPNTPLQETMAALSHIVASGKALYIGLSKYPAEEMRLAADLLQANGTPCILHQSRYSMLERDVEDEVLPGLDDQGIGCVAFSPLAQGLLTDRYLDGAVPPDSRAAGDGGFLRSEHVTQKRVNLANALNEIARTRNQTLAQLALSWVLRHKGMSSVLIGASRPSQIQDAAKAGCSPPLHQSELDAIGALLGQA